MAVYSADLSVGKGLLWLKAPKPRDDGTLVSARRLGPESEAVPARRADMFSHVAYGHSADRFAAVDGMGDIYVFHLRANRFSLVYRAGQEVTALSFCCGKDNDMLVACADKSIRIVKSDTGVAVAKLKSHRATITSLAPHPMERYAVSCGADHTMLWDLESLRRMRNIGSTSKRTTNVQAAFLHSGNTLITLSRQDGLFLYHFPTLDLRAKLLPDPGTVSLRSFAITANRMHLVAATSGRSAYVWHLPSETMIEEIPLPAPVSAIGGLQPLLPYSCTKLPEGGEVSMLGEDGIVRIIDVPMGRVTASVGCATYNFAVHLDRVVTATTDGALHLMDLTHLRDKASGALAGGGKPEGGPPERREVRPLLSAASQSNRQANGGPEADLGLRAIEPLARPTLGTISESSVRGIAKGAGRSRRKAGGSSAALGERSGYPEGMSAENIRWHQRTERLKAYLDVHEAFTEEHRASVWTHLLNIPHNDVAYGALVSLGEMPLAADQLAQSGVADSRVRQRLSRAVHALSHWCEALACSPFLPAFVLPFVRFFGRDEHAAVEACIMLIVNWAPAWFEYWPAPPLHVLAVAERLAFLHDPALVKHLAQIGASTKDYAWPVLQNMFSEVLDHKVWLQLMDHVLVNPPQFVVYLLVAFTVHMRGALMSFRDRRQLPYFVSRVHPVDIRSLLSIARKIEQLARVQEVSEQFGLPSPNQPPPPLQFLQGAQDSSSYPLLTSFPRTAVDHHMQQYMQIREEEQQYLRRKKMAAELEEQSRRMLQQDKANKEQADLVEQARQEQRRQMEALAAQRRERMRALDERAKNARLEQIQYMESQVGLQGQEQARAIAEKQRLAILELDQQLASRFEEEEDWMAARLEAEKLQDIEVATVNKLHRAMQERQQEAQALSVQAEIDARTKMLDVKQRAKEQRWMIEDQQRELETKMGIAQAEREANVSEEAHARTSLEARMLLEEERQKQKLAVVEAQRQARILAEEMAQRQEQRQREQQKVDQVLAAEELRHMDTIARRREAEMRGRMQEGERLIRDERIRLEKLKDARQQRLKLLEARQRMENFERQLAEQQGAWKVAAVEHERQVHQVLLDLEEERRNIGQFDDEIAVREEELRKKVDALEMQKEEHSRFMQGERAKAQHDQIQDQRAAGGGGGSETSGAAGRSDAGSEGKALPRPGERGYWQMRAALAGINVRSKAEGGSEGQAQPKGGSTWSVKRVAAEGAESSTDWSSVSGSDPHEDQGWIKRDVARATATVTARMQRGTASGADPYNFKVSVVEDSSGTGGTSDTSGAQGFKES